jgi:uncharacterized protein
MGRTDVLDLGRLALAPGEARRMELQVPLEPVALGGQSYDPPRGLVDVVLDATRTIGGWSLRIRLEAELHGPCVRCLEPAAAAVMVDAREIDQPGGGDDMESPYVDGIELDLHALVRDAVVLDLPGHIVCREDCLGLCPVCGENLNEAGPGHEHPAEPDSRWAKLSELRFD